MATAPSNERRGAPKAAEDPKLLQRVGEYIDWTETTAVYPKQVATEYLRFGLMSEAGEVAALYKRALRDGKPIAIDEELAELGDCAWYLAQLIPFPEAWATAIERIGEYVNRYKFDHLLTVIVSDVDGMRKIAAFAALCLMRGFKPLDVMHANRLKLEDRKARNMLHGKGGER